MHRESEQSKLGIRASTQEAEVGGFLSEFKVSLGYIVRPCLRERRMREKQLWR